MTSLNSPLKAFLLEIVKIVFWYLDIVGKVLGTMLVTLEYEDMQRSKGGKSGWVVSQSPVFCGAESMLQCLLESLSRLGYMLPKIKLCLRPQKSNMFVRSYSCPVN